MKYTRTAVLAAFLIAALPVLAGVPMQSIEEAYEFNELRIALISNNTGTILARKCDDCEDVKLEVTADSKFFYKGEELPMQQASRFIGRAGVVFREADSMKVTRLKIY